MAFVKYMPQMGWQPVVLSASETVTYGKDYCLLDDIPSNIPVYRIGHKEYSREWHYARMKLKIAGDFPDVYKTWYMPAYRLAKTILQKEKIDLIYNASPAFTTALVAMRLKKEFNIPWVADFLDGWAVNDFLMESLEKSLIKPLRLFYQWRIKKAEYAILTNATKVVTIHPHVKKRWIEMYGLNKDHVEVVTDGYDEAVFKGLTPRPLSCSKLKIIFLGSFYNPFQEIIRNFLVAVHEVDRDAEVFFIGRGVEEVQKMRMPNTVCVLNISRRKSLEYALGSDFLYVVMPPFGKWTPTKTYDYLRLGKPIIASVPADGDAAYNIMNAKAGFVLSFDKGEMKEQIKNIFARHKNGEFTDFNPDYEFVLRFERKYLTRKIVDIFNSITA